MGPCLYGVPQGSVLGPLLTIIYTSKIGPLLTAISLLGHLYADDIQGYLYCPASNATAAILAISKTLGVLESWMSTNCLRLNSSKTQFIWFGTRQQLAAAIPVYLSFTSPLIWCIERVLSPAALLSA